MSNYMIGRSDLMKMSPVNDKQEEILDILKEECAELTQAASKIIRCGIDFQPTHVSGKDTARREFTKEVVDVLLLIQEAAENGLIDLDLVNPYVAEKRDRLRVWTHQLGNGRASLGDLNTFLLNAAYPTGH